MADRVLRWFVAGEIGGIKSSVGGTHILDATYIPIRVHLSCRKATKGDRPLRIDITDDGTSIFDRKPALSAMDDKVWTTVPANAMRKDSIIELHIDQTASIYPSEDLTVELDLEKA